MIRTSHQIPVSEEVVETKKPIETVRLKLAAQTRDSEKEEIVKGICLEREEKLSASIPNLKFSKNKVILNDETLIDTEIADSSEKEQDEEIVRAGQSEAHDKVAEEDEGKIPLLIPQQSEASKEESTKDISFVNKSLENKEEPKTTKTISESSKSLIGCCVVHQNEKKTADNSQQSLQRHLTNRADVNAKIPSCKREISQNGRSFDNDATCYQETTNEISNVDIEGMKAKQRADHEISTIEFDSMKSKIKEQNTTGTIVEGIEKCFEKKREVLHDKSSITKKSITADLTTTNGNTKSNQCITGAMPKVATPKQIVTKQHAMNEIIGYGKNSFCRTSNVEHNNKSNQSCKSNQLFIKERSRQENSNSYINPAGNKVTVEKPTQNSPYLENFRSQRCTSDQNRCRPLVATTMLYHQTTAFEVARQVKESIIDKYQYTTGSYKIKPPLQQSLFPFQTNPAIYDRYNHFLQGSPPVLPIQKVHNTCRQHFDVAHRKSLERSYRQEAIPRIESKSSYFEPEPIPNRNGMLIYCLKCRRKTGTCNSFETVTVKGQPIMKGCCVVCNRNKCSFMKRH